MMNVLLLVKASAKVATARLWFYQMYKLLNDRGLNVYLNDFNLPSYDIIILLWSDLDLIKKAVEHSPKAHIGIFNPGNLGFGDHPIHKENVNKTKLIIDNVDFFMVYSFMWRDMIIKYGKRVYEIFDYEFPETKTIKNHSKRNELIIGYHGNQDHYSKDFFPFGANALKRLSEKYDIKLKVLTNNANTQPLIPGVNTEFIEWDLKTYEDCIKSFDIGICPYFTDMRQLSDPLTYIRGPNRIISLLFYGIPSVASPVPQNTQALENNKHVIFAVSEEGWYQGIERLIKQPKLRNRIGKEGRNIVEIKYSAKAATDRFISILNDEIKEIVSNKKGIKDQDINRLKKNNMNFLKKIKNRIIN